MDQSLAKGLAKQFFYQYPRVLDDKLIDITSQFEMRDNHKRIWARVVDRFGRSWNNFAVHYSELGTKRKPQLGFSTLRVSDHHPDYQRDESVLLVQHQVLTKRPLNVFGLDRIDLVIGIHSISRLFERRLGISVNDCQNCFQIVKNELKYVMFWSWVWRYIAIYSGIHSELRKKISILIPAEGGLFLARFQGSERGLAVDLRTFLDDDKLTDEQLNIKKTLIILSSPYINNPLIYSSSKVPGKGNDKAVEFFFACFFHEIIQPARQLMVQATHDIESTEIKTQLATVFDEHWEKSWVTAEDVADFQGIVARSSFLDAYRNYNLRLGG